MTPQSLAATSCASMLRCIRALAPRPIFPLPPLAQLAMTPDWTAISLGLFPLKPRTLEASTAAQALARTRIAQEKLARKTQRIESCLIEKLIEQLQQSKSAGNTYAQPKRKNMDAISWRKSNDEHLASTAPNERQVHRLRSTVSIIAELRHPKRDEFYPRLGCHLFQWH